MPWRSRVTITRLSPDYLRKKKNWRVSLQPQMKAPLCHLVSSPPVKVGRALWLSLLPPAEFRGHREAFKPHNMGAELLCLSVMRDAQS